ncbi:MAG: hypothetical protein JW944_05695 [Deltaproteobacteria bacterium]|nr:hypothetical protein [Deltaproteobacteria bacterium]
MRHLGIRAALILFFLLALCPSICLSQDEQNITILKYSLKSVEFERSGRFVRARWNLFLVNEAERPVKFVVKICFVDKFNNKINEIKKKYEINANEMKKISEDVLLWEPMARRTRTTRVFIDELDEE